MDPVVSYLPPDSGNLSALASRCTLAVIESIHFKL